MPFIILSSALINIVLNFILIPYIGIIGAALSTVVSYLLLALIVTVWSWKKINNKPDFKFISKVIISSIIMGIFISMFVNESILRITLLILSGAAIYFMSIILLRTFSYKEMKTFIKILKKINYTNY